MVAERRCALIDELFRALGDPTRRAILRLLRDGDLSAGEIAAHFPLAKSTLSGHFTVLRHAGLIQAERHGTTIVYSLSIGAVEELAAAVLSLLGTGEHPTREANNDAALTEKPLGKGES